MYSVFAMFKLSLLRESHFWTFLRSTPTLSIASPSVSPPAGLYKASLNMLFSGQIVIFSKCPTSLTSNISCVPPCFESARNTRHASRFSKKKFLMLMQLTNLHNFST